MRWDTVFIIGGLGRVGSALAATLGKFYKVKIYDIDPIKRSRFLSDRQVIFYEPGINEKLNNDNITLGDFSDISNCGYIIITIGTPIDHYHNPRFDLIFSLLDNIIGYLKDDQYVILSSTLYPGMSQKIQKIFVENGLKTKVVFCPERMATGKMMREIISFPQIIGIDSEKDYLDLKSFYNKVGLDTIWLPSTLAAEFSKLFTNAYRYISFAVANKLFMIAENNNCDFYKIRTAMMAGYPRMKDFPTAGFTGGYCLPKDTLQLAALEFDNFQIGDAAWRINEQFPLFVFRKIRKKIESQNEKLSDKTVLILGRAFKEETDDDREALQIRLANIFWYECKTLLIHDTYIEQFSQDLEEKIKISNIIILATLHEEYYPYIKELEHNESKLFFNVYDTGVGW